MRIGINCSQILNPGYGKFSSVGHYAYYLVSEFLRLDTRHTYILYFDNVLRADAVNRFIARGNRVVVRFFPFHSYSHDLQGRYADALFLAMASRDRLDVLHELDPGFGAVLSGRTIFTVNDMALFRHPELYGRAGIREREKWQQTLAAAAKIIVPTRFIKSEIRKFLPKLLKKTIVIPHGLDITAHHLWTEDVLSSSDHLDKAELRGALKLRENFILSLGTIGRRNNSRALLDAFRLLWKKSANILQKTDLVFAGAKGEGSEQFLHELEKANKETGGRIKYLGYVSNQVKFALLEYAQIFASFSPYEGFAFFPLEAAALGTPVILSDIAPLKETLGKAAVFVNPQNIKEISLALLNILESKSLRQRLIAEGKKLPDKFSWKKTAEETLKLYEKIK